MLLSEEKFKEIATEIACGNSVASKDFECFMQDYKCKEIEGIIARYGLENSEREQELNNAIIEYEYLENEGVYFRDFSECFVDSEGNKFEPCKDVELAFAEYVLFYKNVMDGINWNDNSKNIASEILRKK